MFFEALREHHGTENADVLTWRATSLEMNPTLPAATIARARIQDAAAAATEWAAEFREDLETFLGAELLAGCVEDGCHERPPIDGVAYVGAVDMSGGGPDASTLAIAHAEPGTDPPRVVLDVCRGWREPNVESIVAEMAAHLKRYRITSVTGDRYAGEWVPAAFRRHGIDYEPAARNRSETYLELHSLLATGVLRCSIIRLCYASCGNWNGAPGGKARTRSTIRRGCTMTTRTPQRWRFSRRRRRHAPPMTCAPPLSWPDPAPGRSRAKPLATTPSAMPQRHVRAGTLARRGAAIPLSDNSSASDSR